MAQAVSKPTLDGSSTASSKRALYHLFREFERARSERDAAERRLQRFTDTIQTVLLSLPQEDQSELTLQFDEIKLGSQGRGGVVFDNVVWLFKSNPEKVWTVPEVKEALDQSGKQADVKAVANAISYLSRTGRLLRVSRGRYVIAGIGAEVESLDTEISYGGQRLTEHDY